MINNYYYYDKDVFHDISSLYQQKNPVLIKAYISCCFEK